MSWIRSAVKSFSTQTPGNVPPDFAEAPSLQSKLQRWVLAIAAVALLAGQVALSATAKSLVSFNESVAEKVVSAIGGTPPSQVVASGKLAVNFTLLLDGLDVSQLNGDSEFEIRIGDLLLRHRLGDDLTYTPGRGKARFVVTARNAAGVSTSTTTTTLKWTSTVLKVSIRGKSADAAAAGWDSVQVNSYIGQPTAAVSGNIPAHAILGGVGVSYTIRASGSVVSRAVKAKDGSEHLVTTAKLGGAGTATGTYIPERRVTPGADTVVEVAEVGEAGGAITVDGGVLAGVTVEVPPDAIASPMTFTVAENDLEFSPFEGRYSGAALSIHASGTSSYDKPLLITVPLSSNPDEVPVPYYVLPDGGLQVCFVSSIDRDNGTFTFETSHTSLFIIIYVPDLGSVTGEVPVVMTGFDPAVNGFKVQNKGTVYSGLGECLGMVSFAQWYFRNHGNLHDAFLKQLELPDGKRIKGQSVIATRAQTAMRNQERAKAEIYARSQEKWTNSYAFSQIRSAMLETRRPVIIGMWNKGGPHAVLGIGMTAEREIIVYETNAPGETREISLLGGSASYGIMGGSFLMTCHGEGSELSIGEHFEDIYLDAKGDFQGKAFAQVRITSHKDGDVVNAGYVDLTGTIASGQVLVDRLEVVNGIQPYEATIDGDVFNVRVWLKPGDNFLRFGTKGTTWDDKPIEAINDQDLPFRVFSVKMPLEILKLAGDNQTAPIGDQLKTPLQAVVVDADGTLFPYARVRWRVETGGGKLLSNASTNGWIISEEVRVDSNSTSAMIWKLGAVAAADQKVEAKIVGLDRFVQDDAGYFEPVPLSLSTTGPILFSAANGFSYSKEQFVGKWEVIVRHDDTGAVENYGISDMVLEGGIGIGRYDDPRGGSWRWTILDPTVQPKVRIHHSIYTWFVMTIDVPADPDQRNRMTGTLLDPLGPDPHRWVEIIRR